MYGYSTVDDKEKWSRARPSLAFILWDSGILTVDFGFTQQGQLLEPFTFVIATRNRQTFGNWAGLASHTIEKTNPEFIIMQATAQFPNVCRVLQYLVTVGPPLQYSTTDKSTLGEGAGIYNSGRHTKADRFGDLRLPRNM